VPPGHAVLTPNPLSHSIRSRASSSVKPPIEILLRRRASARHPVTNTRRPAVIRSRPLITATFRGAEALSFCCPPTVPGHRRQQRKGGSISPTPLWRSTSFQTQRQIGGGDGARPLLRQQAPAGPAAHQRLGVLRNRDGGLTARW
jgi:hypothetical protein